MEWELSGGFFTFEDFRGLSRTVEGCRGTSSTIEDYRGTDWNHMKNIKKTKDFWSQDISTEIWRWDVNMIATSRKITECDRFQANERQQAEIDQKTEKTRETPGMPGFRSKHWKNHLPQGFTNLDAFCLLQTCKHKRKLEAQRVCRVTTTYTRSLCFLCFFRPFCRFDV